MILLRCRGYHRRRGWLAWHTGILAQTGGKQYPALGDLTGEARTARAGQTPEQLLHAVKLWKAALGQRA